jgi:hypothetical protein
MVQGLQALISSVSLGIDKYAKSITRKTFQPFYSSQTDERGIKPTVATGSRCPIIL